MTPSFIDVVTVHAVAGDGGNGCASIRREKFKPLGGPDGANGGRGGSVVLVADPAVHTLLAFHTRPHLKAGSGGAGKGDHRTGADGADVISRVPVGTVVSDDTGVLVDLVTPGQTWVLAAGGRGGLGNAALASPRRKAPGFALLGEPGEARDAVLELKTVADAALVGFPSSGKSSLIAAMSAARPKIADYPFTTLQPNLGVVRVDGHVFTMADVPGLIPGASAGKGLGLEFLRHIERCRVIVHVIDAATLEPNRDPVSDLAAIEHELDQYGTFADRPRIIVLNKVDVPEARELAELVLPDLAAHGWPVLPVSAASHAGLRELGFAIANVLDDQTPAEPDLPRIVLTPQAVDDKQFSVRRVLDHSQGAPQELFVVRGRLPERWVRQTDFGNDEAVGYLADRLARLGVEDELFAAGARAGCTVVIGPVTSGVVFDWEPTVSAGGYRAASPRGTDARLEP